MFQTRHSFLASLPLCALVLPAMFVTARGQTTSSADTKLALKAALVLTPGFCATKMKKKSETFEIGKAACAELKPVLEGVFSSLTSVTSASSPGDAQVVLLPRFVDVSTTYALSGLSNRKMDVLLEWTVKDTSGRTVWIETVQGSAMHHMGTMGSVKKNRMLIVEDSVKAAAQQSASKMSSASELRKLTQ